MRTNLVDDNPAGPTPTPPGLYTAKTRVTVGVCPRCSVELLAEVTAEVEVRLRPSTVTDGDGNGVHFTASTSSPVLKSCAVYRHECAANKASLSERS